jgi:hypothetical protein
MRALSPWDLAVWELGARQRAGFRENAHRCLDRCRSDSFDDVRAGTVYRISPSVR